MEHRAYGPVDVVRVHAGERVTKVDGDRVGQACREAQYSPSASAAGKIPLSIAAIAVGRSIATMVVMPSVMLIPTSA